MKKMINGRRDKYIITSTAVCRITPGRVYREDSFGPRPTMTAEEALLRAALSQTRKARRNIEILYRDIKALVRRMNDDC